MLRPAYSPTRPRESVFISGPLPQDNEPVNSPYIEACVASVQETCNEIHDAQQSLRRGVADLPRMSRVLENERLFTLVNESCVASYEAQLVEEIEPQISELIVRAEKGVKNLERKENIMTSKLEAARSRASSRTSAGLSVAMRKINALTEQREALEKQVQSLMDDINNLEEQLMDPRTK